MPELEKLQQAGDGQNDSCNAQRLGSGKAQEDQQAPEDLIQHAAQGTADPLRRRPVVELAVEAQGHDQKEGEKSR
jgi:hypothetical protein